MQETVHTPCHSYDMVLLTNAETVHTPCHSYDMVLLTNAETVHTPYSLSMNMVLLTNASIMHTESKTKLKHLSPQLQTEGAGSKTRMQRQCILLENMCWHEH